MIAVVDYGAGNLSSLYSALGKVYQGEICVTQDAMIVESSTLVVLPGVGSFGSAMQVISDRGLDVAIDKAKANGARMLGICLGMHLFFRKGFEGSSDGVSGLGLLEGSVRSLSELDSSSAQLEFIPRVGWKKVNDVDGKIMGWAYFTHSFYADGDFAYDKLMTTPFNDMQILAGVQSGTVTGYQFHPEKSGDFGLKLLKKFVES